MRRQSPRESDRMGDIGKRDPPFVEQVECRTSALGRSGRERGAKRAVSRTLRRTSRNLEAESTRMSACCRREAVSNSHGGETRRRADDAEAAGPNRGRSTQNAAPMP